MALRKLTRKDTFKSKYDINEQRKNFEIKDNEQLRKYDAIYIPTLPSDMRKSDSDAHFMYHNKNKNKHN